uniref:Photosystem I reaction center subunit XII n=1 Tax=Cyanidium caldarium TaxID=2771 RepID=PSAM_CYACA|nr:photosystem I protein M [Cyanidium caldarium]Q9TLX5.1 RecName: Full=Photosystem I reaction center subunit XII; AltName: Full=PSI-M [Cyanidium caldarium]AAF12951.1 unknown [Cyanidium caldarium]WDB00266.1 photosystem I protein M [Cyanidium caldarium]
MITDSQVFIGLVIALVPAILAFKLGLSLYE